MTKILKHVLPFTLVIGSLLIALHLYSLEGYTIIDQRSFTYANGYTWTYYHINILQYLKNLQTSLNISQLGNIFSARRPDLILPKQWDVIGILKFMVNILFVYLTNWIIYILNIVIVYPTKLLLYPINIFLALFGINTADEEFISTFQYLYRLNIPTIPNIM